MANMLTNPTFDADVTGWTVTTGSASSVAGGLDGTNGCRITNNSTTVNGVIYQDITTVVGETYVFLGFGTCESTATCAIQLGTSANATLFHNVSIPVASGWVGVAGSFKATTTTSRITLSSTFVGGNASASSLFDKMYLNLLSGYITDFSPCKDGLKGSTKRPFPAWYNDTNAAIFAIDMTGTLSGTVSIPGGPSAAKSCRITVTDKISRRVVASTAPAGDGTFTFTGLDKTNPNRYFVLCEAPAGYNAIVYDKMNVT